MATQIEAAKMAVAELKACPWCGTMPLVAPTNPEADGDNWTRVTCTRRECVVMPQVLRCGDNHQAEAIAAWNTRAAPARDAGMAAEVARLSKALKIIEINDFRTEHVVVCDDGMNINTTRRVPGQFALIASAALSERPNG